MRKGQRWWLLTAVSGLIYLAYAIWLPLWPNFDAVPQLDIYRFTPAVVPALAYALSLVTLLLLYWAAFELLAQGKAAPPVGTIFAVAAVFGLLLLFVYPFNATDLFRYYIRGRVTVIYGASPYLAPPAAFVNDPFLLLAGEWAGHTSPYGPLWEMVAAAVVRLVGDNLLWALLTFKLIGLTLFLAAGLFIWHGSAELAPAARRGRLLLWLWCPPLLLTFVANGHNDIMMIVLLLAGWLLAQRGRHLWGWWLFGLAPLAKPIGLLALPFLFVWQLRRQGDWPARLRFALPAGLGTLLLLLIAFAPFGSPLALAERLLNEARGGASFSPVTLIILLSRQFSWGWTFAAVGGTATALFVVFALGLLWWTWRGGSPLMSVALVFGAYLLQALSYRIWYAAWLFPWLLLRFEPDSGAGRLAFRAGLLFLVTSQFSVLIYGHLYRVIGDLLWSHLLGVPFTFGLPMLLALIFARRAKKLGTETDRTDTV